VFLPAATTTKTRGKKFDLALVLREARADRPEIDPLDIWILDILLHEYSERSFSAIIEFFSN